MIVAANEQLGMVPPRYRLLIDERSGSADCSTLDVAVKALATLQGFGRKVGVISHAAATVERVPTQVRMVKR